ncbi:hypothetical protein GCM10011369_21730 [Neiella marina]|uniref:Uncharacterized protein n=1 Tax=Neiella marina TaxID=508461 RepID=A0A8J2U5K7_9GAMM|nr:hypothetical protein [Neiella marina]GGA79434.1 hypothetical protein GCM10011369_21730 [Neiella marina]
MVQIMRLASLFVGAVLLLSGCSQIGASRLQSDNISYISAISDATKEQMLSNVVRIRYMDIPVFLDVSSVLTQYSYGGNASAGYLSDNGFTGSSVNAGVGGQYSERPTITFLPLSGHEFAMRMMRPIPVDFVFAIAQGGWPVDVLMSAGLQQLNDVENMSFGITKSHNAAEQDEQYQSDLEDYQRFQHVLRLIIKLGNEGAFEVRNIGASKQMQLIFEANPDEEHAAAIAELKSQLSLDPSQNNFLITSKQTSRSDQEITVKTRGLLPIMSVMSRGIVIPAPHQQAVVNTHIDPNTLPMTIHSSVDYPSDAYLAISYRDHWFYIRDDDIMSKRYFGLMMYLYNIQASPKSQQAPLLTLPAG